MEGTDLLNAFSTGLLEIKDNIPSSWELMGLSRQKLFNFLMPEISISDIVDGLDLIHVPLNRS